MGLSQFTLKPEDFDCYPNCDYLAMSEEEDLNPVNTVNMINPNVRSFVKAIRLLTSGIDLLTDDHPDKAAIDQWQQEVPLELGGTSEPNCTLVIQGSSNIEVFGYSDQQSLRDFVTVSNGLGELSTWLLIDGEYIPFAYGLEEGVKDEKGYKPAGFVVSPDIDNSSTDDRFLGGPYKSALLAAMKHPITYTCYPVSHQ